MKQQNIVHYNYVILFKNDNVNQNNPILYDSDITKIRMYNKSIQNFSWLILTSG